MRYTKYVFHIILIKSLYYKNIILTFKIIKRYIMYAYVRNIFNQSKKSFIKITSIEEMDIYEFFQKLQLLLGENPYDINSGLSLEAIQNNDLITLNSQIASLINKYSYLGNIEFNINSSDNHIEVHIEMMLNHKIANTSYISKSFKLKRE